jgi:hypothetical protein
MLIDYYKSARYVSFAAINPLDSKINIEVFALLGFCAMYVGSCLLSFRVIQSEASSRFKQSLENGTDSLSRKVGNNYQHTLSNNRQGRNLTYIAAEA